MEHNFKDLKMKLKKSDLIAEYATAINTIEVKDQHINQLNSSLNEAKKTIDELTIQIKTLNKTESPTNKITNDELKKRITILEKENQEVLSKLGVTLDAWEKVLKANQITNDIAVDTYSNLKNEAIHKWGGK